ncbi:MAG: hypothetical protein EX263_09610 [Flavobacteriaceae bacterium]|nr:MAG: hypothetical protein EX263_09610 [Flavobacteriaceae bacterium]
MKFKSLFLVVLILPLIFSCEQELKPIDVIEASIKYHDPSNNWDTFNGQLNITMTIPDQPERLSDIKINLPEEYFYVEARRDTLTTVYEVSGNDCRISFNGETEFSEQQKKDYRLDCDTAKRYRDYYTYLYGLPMKLKDPGTHISDALEVKTFKGKEYLVVKATYDEAVGSDIWYFYFDLNTFAMEIYQFFKTDANGNLDSASGEYILLTEEKVVNDIKMPKVRAWYYNKDDVFLGTDVLN